MPTPCSRQGPAPQPHSIEALAEAVAAFIDAEGLHNCILEWYSKPMWASLTQHPRFPAMLKERQCQEGPATELAEVLRSCSPGRQHPLWSRLPSLACPALFVAGSLDNKFVRLGRDMARLVSSSHRRGDAADAGVPECGHDRDVLSSNFRAVEGCGHAVHIESPEQLAPMIAQWCCDLSGL
ncbi:hypothetical protein WJX73_000619 [Symbiochloris irregularis]|uniref:AB hydrolase-1 domain-containing protein n=1 Tax=Symbiochloris irregularis TaxID=706552 RepID=A0AAW1PBG8_9CHLO